MANTRRNRKVSRKDRKSRRNNMAALRKSRKASRRSNMVAMRKGRKASRKTRKARRANRR